MKRLLRSRDGTEFNFVEGRRLIQSSGMDRRLADRHDSRGREAVSVGST